MKDFCGKVAIYVRNAPFLSWMLLMIFCTTVCAILFCVLGDKPPEDAQISLILAIIAFLWIEAMAISKIVNLIGHWVDAKEYMNTHKNADLEEAWQKTTKILDDELW